jgi:C-terminal processing protease CtpA/Prc
MPKVFGWLLSFVPFMRVTLAIIAFLAFGLAALAEEIAGIGVDLTQRTNELVKAYRIHPGSPAEKAGVKPGGFLISVDGTNVVNMSLTQAMKIVRGPVGTSVTIQLADTSMTHTNTFTMKRSRIVIVDNEFKFIDH